MKFTLFVIILAIAAAAVALPALAGAQDPVRSFDALSTRLKPGDRVWVTDAHGREVEGTIQGLLPDALTVKDGAVRTFAARDVTLIRQRQHDSLKNGTLIGLGIGGGLAAAWCIGAMAADDEGVDPGVECAEGFIVFGGFGTLLGVAIDALIPGKKVDVYRAPASGGPARPRVSIAPFVTTRTRSVALTFAF